MRTLDLLDVQLRPNGKNHNDVLIRLGQREVIGDSYYLALDRNHRPGDESEEKVRDVFARLLASCAAKVESLEDGESAYLPLDFQDEWLGCLRCERRGNQFSIVFGELDENGYSVWPSAPGDVFSADVAFRQVGGETLVARSELLSALAGLAMSAAAQVRP